MSWYPIAASSDLTFRTTHAAQLLGRELVAWRADDGHVNVWENRCLHRGVRLSIGANDGAELVCSYHGWRYANQTAGCTYIPAHPANAPAQTICNRTYPAVERYGLVWSAVETDAADELPDLATGSEPMALRGIPVNAPPADVRLALADDDELVYWVQPVDAHRSVIRGVLLQALHESDRRAVLWAHNTRLSRLRDDLEAEALARGLPAPLVVSLEPASTESTGLPVTGGGRRADQRVTVARKWETSADVVAIELRTIGEPLVTFQPGAHVDLHLPNGLVRQYSLTNGPGELDHYRIGVKREPASRGGSSSIHDTVREGDVLAISEPRNNFTLRRDSERTVLIAGGIGVTPLLAMAQALEQNGLRYELHVFARSDDHLPFAELLSQLGSVTTHFGRSPDGTASAVAALLGAHSHSAQVYVCGPAPMMDATIATAVELGWPEDALHLEHFANATIIDDSTAFEVSLARSALTLNVPAGRSLLDVLRDHDVELPSSCEQGACGTCVVGVVDGTPLHQDVCLRPSEREANDRIATCVSRAIDGPLTLDL